MDLVAELHDVVDEFVEVAAGACYGIHKFFLFNKETEQRIYFEVK